MAEVWSFNTTVRNPERMENLLRILSDMEGTTFDAGGQEHFFGLQIKKRFYTPTRATLGDDLSSAVYDSDPNEDIDDNTVNRIIDKYRGSVDSAGRGRTSVAVLNRFGLCIALQSHSSVIITPLGKKWLSGEIDDEELFTRFLLRWQYPNPIESGYNEFDIKPFPAVLRLIKGVNDAWQQLGNQPVGLSKGEYRLFALSLKSKNSIELATTQIIAFRQKSHNLSGKERSDFISNFERQRVIAIYGYSNEDNLRRQIGSLRDYADSSLRYFRISGLIALRGAGRHVDIAKDKMAEAMSIVESVSIQSLDFTTAEAYLEYLGDLSYDLPWQNEKDLQKITDNLTEILDSEAKEVSVAIDNSDIIGKTLVKQVDILQEKINDVRIEKLRLLRHDVSALDEAIHKISIISSSRYEPVTSRPSLDFEWYVSRAMMVLNDALRIEPSYKVGDDGLPTGFRGNLSDIECEYDNFGMTVEVTLLCGRDQWTAEGQPVMRHLRDFENTIPKKKAFCLFVAPHIHRDTLNTFWISNKYEFEGRPQNIFPLTIEQFVDFLKSARSRIVSGSLGNATLEDLVSNLSGTVAAHTDSTQWQENLKELVSVW
ncbi:AlwI family type II restriction endonuclease [Candidatus Roizmanbacteria bacterium]|nr:AlwI family type II restriction endonuclease [Candidatus Roizmanbacteria bacterium]